MHQITTLQSVEDPTLEQVHLGCGEPTQEQASGRNCSPQKAHMGLGFMAGTTALGDSCWNSCEELQPVRSSRWSGL